MGTKDYDKFMDELKAIDQYNLSLETNAKIEEENKILLIFNKCGYAVTHLADLSSNPNAVSGTESLKIAIEWLPKTKEVGNKRSLLGFICNHALKKSFKDEILDIIFNEYKKSRPIDHIIRMYVGNLAMDLASDSEFNDILSLARNDTNQDLDEGGRFTSLERVFFVTILGKMKKHPEVTDELLKLLKDEYVRIEAIIALGNLKNPKAIPHLKPFLNHKEKHVRKYAETAIAKIEKAQNKK